MALRAQKHGKHRYIIVRGFSFRDIKSGKVYKLGRGEPIPPEILKDDDKRTDLLKAGKIGIIESDGALRENPHEIKLSPREIEDLVENPTNLTAALSPSGAGKQSLRFHESSLQQMKRLLQAKGAPKALLELVERALVN